MVAVVGYNGTIDGIYWGIYDDGLLEIKCTTSTTGVMPDFSTTSPAPWAEHISAVRYINIYDGITRIGAYAFPGADIDSIHNIYFPSTLVSIGELAFYDATIESTLTFPDSLTALGSHSFLRQSSPPFPKLVFGSGLTDIGVNGNFNTMDIYSPDGATKIGSFSNSYIDMIRGATFTYSSELNGYIRSEPYPTMTTTSGIDTSKNLVDVMTKSETETALAGKQDKLAAGSNITISDDNVISATGGSAGVSSFNTLTGNIKQDIITSINQFTSTANTTKLIYGSLLSTGNTRNVSTDLPTCSDSQAGVVTSSQKKSWDAKQDAITVSSSAPTSSDGADGDIWLTYGADSGTLPGGGGGASLPSDGYYWEKITEENWPTDWKSGDVIMVFPTHIKYVGDNQSWTSIISFGLMTDVGTNCYPVIMAINMDYDTTVFPYFTDMTSYGAMLINGVTIATTGTGFNNSDSNTDMIDLVAIAYNGYGIERDVFYTMTRSDMTSSGLYRLRKFS